MPPPPPPPDVPGCTEPFSAHGFCSYHAPAVFAKKGMGYQHGGGGLLAESSAVYKCAGARAAAIRPVKTKRGDGPTGCCECVFGLPRREFFSAIPPPPPPSSFAKMPPHLQCVSGCVCVTSCSRLCTYLPAVVRNCSDPHNSNGFCSRHGARLAISVSAHGYGGLLAPQTPASNGACVRMVAFATNGRARGKECGELHQRVSGERRVAHDNLPISPPASSGGRLLQTMQWSRLVQHAQYSTVLHS